MAANDKPSSTLARSAINIVGVILIFAGIAAAGGFIAALAGGFEGWAIVAAIAVLVLLGGGILAVREGARRRARESNAVVYAPDNSDDTFDIDSDTGARTRRSE